MHAEPRLVCGFEMVRSSLSAGDPNRSPSVPYSAFSSGTCACETGEPSVADTWGRPGNTVRPWIFDDVPHTVRLGDPDRGIWIEWKGQRMSR